MVLGWRRPGRVGGCQLKKKDRRDSVSYIEVTSRKTCYDPNQVLPVIREFKRLSFLMTGKTVKIAP